jgi:hypothetical protein
MAFWRSDESVGIAHSLQSLCCHWNWNSVKTVIATCVRREHSSDGCLSKRCLDQLDEATTELLLPSQIAGVVRKIGALYPTGLAMSWGVWFVSTIGRICGWKWAVAMATRYIKPSYCQVHVGPRQITFKARSADRIIHGSVVVKALCYKPEGRGF